VLPVCRFFGTPDLGPNCISTPRTERCASSATIRTGSKEGVTFRARLPSAGVCAVSDVTVQRLWWRGDTATASRHRYVTDRATADAMRAAGWVLEGPVFCAPA
jgi:hypothetical protein